MNLSSAERHFHAIVGPTFEGSYYEDQLGRIHERPASKLDWLEPVTAWRNSNRKSAYDKRPAGGVITGMRWNATAGYYTYDVTYDTDGWTGAGSISPSERSLNLPEQRDVIARRRKHYKFEEADRFHGELASWMAANRPPHVIGDLVAWSVPAFTRSGRGPSSVLPERVEAVIVGMSVRDHFDWEGDKRVWSFSWEYDMLPAIGISHHRVSHLDQLEETGMVAANRL